MSALSLRLPKSLHEQLREVAQEEGISVNQFIMLAVAEKVAALSAIEFVNVHHLRFGQIIKIRALFLPLRCVC